MVSFHAALSILCAIGCCAAELASPHRVVNDRPRYYNASHNRQRHIHPNYYNRSPVYQYNQAETYQKEINHGNNHNRRLHYRPIQSHSTGIYRTYGRGTAVVPRMGATVTVLNNEPSPKVYKGTVTARILKPSQTYNDVPSRITAPSRSCMGCPQNRVVIASKGNAEVILPEPCPTMRWASISGPQPGSKIKGGLHTLIGRLGHRGKICRYTYEVIVRRCTPISIKHGWTNCTAGDAWGSTCTVACEDGYEVHGSADIKCEDDLKWSATNSVCKKKIWCPLPQTPDDTKIWCQVEDENDLTENKLPANTYCRFRVDGKRHMITCIDGYWVINRGFRKNRNAKRKKHRMHKPNFKDYDVYPKAQVQVINQDI